MQAKEIITKKREGGENSKEELEFFLKGFLRGDIKDYQVSAWLMAVFFRGMSSRELSHWTELMWRSGSTLSRNRAKETPVQYWVDKHSTGGIGDKTSLILVPLVSAISRKYIKNNPVRIPMISGRGLGHTGGTLDKLESVSGFCTQLNEAQALKLIETQGFFMVGQTEDIAPADRLLYSLRDVTGTIESIPLIVSSIMSKKLSENLDGIVFDVKTGLGAFMTEFEQSKLLAEGLLSVAKNQGLDAVALISQMDQPLGTKVGNFLEVEECADFLKGLPRDPELEKLTIETASWMIHLGSGKKVTLKEAKEICFEVVENGEAFSIFKQMFESQGGDFSHFEVERESFRKNYYCYEFKAYEKGSIEQIHARKIGVLLVAMGGGRVVKEASVDTRVGFEILKKVGDNVEVGETVLKAYYRDAAQINSIQSSLKEAVRIKSDGPHQVETKPILREIITA